MTNLSEVNVQTEQSKFLPRIAKSDKAAAHECINFYGAMVWALTKQSIVSNEAAEKAVQEIFTDIWENARFYDLNVSDERVWIAMVAHRRLEKYTAEIVL